MIGPSGQVYDFGPLSFQFVPITFLNANAPYRVSHKLELTDVGWIVVSKDRAGDIFEGPLPRALGSVTLVSNTAELRAIIMVVAPNLTKR
jgi:hypothetical protein